MLVALLRFTALVAVAAATADRRQMHARQSTLAVALETARQDVLKHVGDVEAQIAASDPPPGSVGAYLLDAKVYQKAAIFSLFNTTFLNEQIPNATDTETELVFQATGVATEGTGAGLDADMWLRDSLGRGGLNAFQ